jgi:hypothetical protein
MLDKSRCADQPDLCIAWCLAKLLVKVQIGGDARLI